MKSKKGTSEEVKNTGVLKHDQKFDRVSYFKSFVKQVGQISALP